jgi:hypothetical protein
MKNKIKIFAIFVMMFFASFVPESNHELFGDWRCKGGHVIYHEYKSNEYIGCQYGADDHHSSTWHWGARHWIWLLAGLTFTTWTIVEIINKEINK